MTLYGIDVSHYQAKTPSLAGRAFLLAKASEGTTADPMYHTHIAAARSAGLVVGAYAFSRDDVDVGDQARFFLAIAGDVDLYAIDVEGVHGFSAAQTRQFVAAVHAAGKRIGLYHSLAGFFDAGQDWNWVACWGCEPPVNADIWQYRGAPLDLDRFEGDRHELLALGASLPDTSTEDPVIVTVVKAEDWTPTVTGGQSNGVFRAVPDRAAPVVARVPAGTVVRSIAEVTTVAPAPNGNWRLTARNGEPLYMLRSDWTPVVAGGDPAVDAQLQAVIDRQPPDCTTQVAAAVAPYERRIEEIVKLAQEAIA